MARPTPEVKVKRFIDQWEACEYLAIYKDKALDMLGKYSVFCNIIDVDSYCIFSTNRGLLILTSLRFRDDKNYTVIQITLFRDNIEKLKEEITDLKTRLKDFIEYLGDAEIENDKLKARLKEVEGENKELSIEVSNSEYNLHKNQAKRKCADILRKGE